MTMRTRDLKGSPGLDAAGKLVTNHNLRVKTGLKAGKFATNHNLRIKTG